MNERNEERKKVRHTEIMQPWIKMFFLHCCLLLVLNKKKKKKILSNGNLAFLSFEHEKKWKLKAEKKEKKKKGTKKVQMDVGVD